jgi:hypothetical protein
MLERYIYYTFLDVELAQTFRQLFVVITPELLAVRTQGEYINSPGFSPDNHNHKKKNWDSKYVEFGKKRLCGLTMWK